jgi:hypothetical protein
MDWAVRIGRDLQAVHFSRVVQSDFLPRPQEPTLLDHGTRNRRAKIEKSSLPRRGENSRARGHTKLSKSISAIEE